MTTSSDINTLAVKVGEISGQLLELIHNQNNMAQKIDALTERALTGPSASDFAQLATRVDALEAERHRNDGAKGLGLAILKSPVVGWIVGLALGFYAFIKGEPQ